MTDRDELIGRAWKLSEDIDRVFDDGVAGLLVNVDDMCAALVDDGWRPPPSGDVVEQVRTVIRNETGACRCDPMYTTRNRVDPECTWCYTGDGLAEILAAAGLLATTPVAADDAVAALRSLVALKDGPRDDHYYARRDAAWDRARAATRAIAGKTDE